MSSHDPVPMVSEWRFEPVVAESCIEWHVSVDVDLRPGIASIRDESRLLYFAPAYLLAINAGTGLPGELTASATAVDSTGKWRGFRLSGASAPKVLTAGAQVGFLLRDRECAALPLFDCPVVLLRIPEAYELWVLSSYAESLRSALQETAVQQSVRETTERTPWKITKSLQT